MGLGNTGNQFKTFLTIYNGKFSRTAEPDEEGAVSRVNKKGKTVYEMHYDTLSDVYIRNIEKKTGEYGAQWIVSLQDDQDSFDLQLSYNGSVTNGLFFRLPNIIIDQPVTFKIYHFEEGDKTKNSMVIYQNGEKVSPFFTREEPNGVPDMEKVMDKGVEKWSDTARYLYFEEMITSHFKPVFDSMKAERAANPPAAKPVAATTAQPVKTEPAPGVVTPLISIPNSEPLKMEYTFACQAGYKNSLGEYKELKSEWQKKADAGYEGSIMDLHALKSSAATNVQGNPPLTSQKPAATTAAKPPMPPVKTSGAVKAGASVDPLTAGYEGVKRGGYAGSIEDFSKWCEENGCEPTDAIVNPAGELEPSGLPF